MTSEACEVSPETKSFLDNAIEFCQDAVSNEVLQLLLTDEEAWKGLVAEAGLSRDEAVALREGLNKLNTDMAMEEKHMIEKDQLYRKKFMDEFPRVKQELEERIGKLHTLADKVDKVHRDCTISNVVAASTGTVSGILTILGLALAPVTAGVSLALSATGIGLGAAAAVTGVSTSIVDYSSKLSAKAEASRLTSIDSDKEMLKESLRHNAPHIGMETIGKNLRAIKLGKPKPPLVSPAVGLVTIGTVSVQSIKQVQKSFEGTALAMAKGARVMGAATAGVFLLMDVISLVEESLHLHEGAKAESAEELRQQAQELERMLEELSQTHERLQQGLIPQPPE